MKATPELKTVTFYREAILKHPKQEDLSTLEDADEHKLPAMDKLLKQMFLFYNELNIIGLSLQIDNDDRYPIANSFILQDTEYTRFDEFKIIIKSNWFNPKQRHLSLHAGFEFHLYLIQDAYQGRSEIADWINIFIKHLSTTPISFASNREHVKVLQNFLSKSNVSYFHDLPMEYATSVTFSKIKTGLSFKTSLFNQAVDDSCRILQKIIDRKNHLVVYQKK